MNFDEEQIRRLAKVLTETGLDEIEVERGGERIRVRRAGAQLEYTTGSPGHTGFTSAPPTAQIPMQPAPGPAESPAEAEGEFVESPFVGTFYRAPSPEADPFADVGHSVDKGSVLCIVEAMKLMNEIEADFDCTVEQVLVKNGDAVEYGQRLFRVRRR